MQSYSFSIAVRIWHPSINPQEVSATLGMRAKHSAIAGSQRTTPNGRALGGVYAESYWHSDPFERGEYASTDDVAEDVLIDVLQLLSPHKEFLLRLKQQGARLHLQVSSFGTRTYALELPPEVLAQFSELGLSFVHDVYPCTQGF
jgi:Domain of unknown function (DUF4279)